MKLKRHIIATIAILLLASFCWSLSDVLSGSNHIVRAQEVEIPREEELVFGHTGALSPHYNPVAYWGMEPYTMTGYGPVVYENLAYYAQTASQWKPWLARSWEWTGPLTFMIYLREEPYFRNGSPVTAEDVVFSLSTLGNKTFGGPLVEAFATYVKSIEVVDTRTVQVNVAEGYSNDIRLTSLLNMPIFTKARWSRLIREMGIDGVLKYLNADPEEMDGSGPYTLYYAAPDRTIYIRVDNWWGNKIGWSVAPKYYEMRKFESMDVEAREYKAGMLDTSHATLEDGYDFVRSDKERFAAWDVDAADWGSMVAPGATGQKSIVLNYKIPILRQRWFREALAYAINYEKIAELVPSYPWGSPTLISTALGLFEEYANESIVSENFETKIRGGFVQIAYDPEKAVEILKEHCEGSVEEGWTWNGEKIGPFEIMTTDWTHMVLMITAISEDFTKIGISTSPEFVTYEMWLARHVKYDYDMSFTDYSGAGPLDPIDSYHSAFVGSPGGWTAWGYQYQWYFNGSYPECENTAGEVAKLIDEGFRYPIGSAKSIEIVKKIQSIVVPQLFFIPYYRHYAFANYRVRDYWTNWPTKDDPYETSEAGHHQFFLVRGVKSSKIETVDFSISPGIVEVGKSAAVSVTLKNTGNYEHLHQVDVTLGPAKPGLYLTWLPPEVIAYAITTVPAGETKTVTIAVKFDEPGSYTLTVDAWRIGKYDAGEPWEQTLIVTEAAPPSEYTVEDAVKAADAAKTAAENASRSAEAAKAAAENALSSAEAAKTAAENAAPMWMVWASMIITIVVVLAGVYAITRGKR